MLFRMFLENQESDPESGIQADLLMMLILSEVGRCGKFQDASITQSKLNLVSERNLSSACMWIGLSAHLKWPIRSMQILTIWEESFARSREKPLRRRFMLAASRK